MRATPETVRAAAQGILNYHKEHKLVPPYTSSEVNDYAQTFASTQLPDDLQREFQDNAYKFKQAYLELRRHPA